MSDEFNRITETALDILARYAIFHETDNPTSEFVVKQIELDNNDVLIVYDLKKQNAIIRFIFDYDNKQIHVCDDFGGHGFSWTNHDINNKLDVYSKVTEILEQLGFARIKKDI
jgi:hypothetical protein